MNTLKNEMELYLSDRLYQRDRIMSVFKVEVSDEMLINQNNKINEVSNLLMGLDEESSAEDIEYVRDRFYDLLAGRKHKDRRDSSQPPSPYIPNDVA